MATSPYYDCVVIGGGASGFFTAIRLKEEAPPLSVCILEAQQSTLGKVKISGGGRCNVIPPRSPTTVRVLIVFGAPGAKANSLQ